MDAVLLLMLIGLHKQKKFNLLQDQVLFAAAAC